MKKFLGIVVTLALFASASLQADAAVVIVNGTFEANPTSGPPLTPNSYLEVSAGSTLINGWTVGAAGVGEVDLVNKWANQNGAGGSSQYVDLLGTPGGNPTWIEQTISFASGDAGKDYNISFQYSRNGGSSASGRLEVYFESDPFTPVQSLSFTHSATIGPAPNGLEWTLGSLLLQNAAEGDYTFRWVQTNPASGNAGIFLDNVNIAATPEPATLVVWSGLAAIGAVVAYRRRVAA